MKLLNRLLVLGMIALIAGPLWADKEQELIAILQSSADVPAKCTACQHLKLHGTARSVPALAALLLESEALSHAARNALEGMPFPEAGAALRAALSRSSGVIKVGLVDSLGWRRDEMSVSLLVPLLQDKEEMLATTAATALGRIASPDAEVALNAAQEEAKPVVRIAVLEALLNCAEERLKEGRTRSAAAVYQDLFKTQVPCPQQIRDAAWRGWVLSDRKERARLILQALEGKDLALQQAALKLVRELKDAAVLKACVREWDSLGEAAQLAVLEGQIVAKVEARDAMGRASQSPHLAVRVAAWKAMADGGLPGMVPSLARAAAQGEEAEREAAREGLARLHGPGAQRALVRHLKGADDSEKVEVLLALGERNDREVAPLLLKVAESEKDPVRLAALTSLRRLAVAETLSPLIELTVSSSSDSDRDAVLKALSAVCQACPDKEESSRQIIASVGRFPASERVHLLPLLAELGSSEALSFLKEITRGSDVELAREAIRALSQWPDAGPAAYLLELARTHNDETARTLAFRGAIPLGGRDPEVTRRLALLRSALELAQRTDEKSLVLSQLAQITQRESLDLVLPLLEDSSLRNEAGAAALSIAEVLAKTEPALADEVARKVLDRCQAPAIVNRAWALRVKPGSGGLIIRDWLVCGPYRQAGASGAVSVFNIEAGPEKQGEPVQWFAAPLADSVPLSSLFPGQDSCVAYLKAEILAPAAVDAILLMGSDDGIKAWMNGTVVHSNNVDRGQIADQDVASVKLNQGSNELLLKITQGGGGWSACARIVGADGLPIQGLSAKAQEGIAPPVQIQAPPPVAEVVPQDATLPPRAPFQTLRLSEEFYAEGAYYGDFNRDGNMDVVAGPFWFAGPDYKERHEYRPSTVYDPKNYSDNFLTFTGDFNGDGWTDILCAPMPGTESHWFANPAGKNEPWARHLALPFVGNESPVWHDVTGDHQPELVFCIDGFLGYAGPNTSQPDQPWVFHPISGQDPRYQRFTHGVGCGDINGDGRVDVVEAVGWWEHGADSQSNETWTFHPFRFAEAGAQMLITDVDGDGLTDVITAWHCHLYGLVWWKQVKGSGGQMDWQQQVILSPTPDVSTTDFRVSQLHALELVDMNGDGLQDILTGKRFWSHGPTGDKEPDAPAVVFWFELHRQDKGEVRFVPRLIDDNSGVGTQVATTDLNKDGKPDVIVANKKGIFVHWNQQPPP